MGWERCWIASERELMIGCGDDWHCCDDGGSCAVDGGDSSSSESGVPKRLRE